MAADCGCSGVRSCLVCESRKGEEMLTETESNAKGNLISLSFCIKCQKPFSGALCSHSRAKGTTENSEKNEVEEISLTGVTVLQSFINKDEELFIMLEIEKFPWRISQSGRRKQDFGPKVNFKKKKLKCGKFSGLPSFSRFFVERLQKHVPQLKNFHPVELCNLDYCPERGASIDPHIDDSWLWGENLVTLNLLSDTILTLTNIDHMCEVKIPMPQYSLVILKGDSRYKWMHGIKRSDITSRRIAVTLRELSQEFASGVDYEEIGNSLLGLAASYKGLPSSS